MVAIDPELPLALDGFAGPYARFYRSVALAQLDGWLPADASYDVVDLSGADGDFAAHLSAAGHRVVHVARDADHVPAERAGLRVVVADTRELSWLARRSADAVLAEGGALCFSLAAEETVADIARVLRPGGRLLVCVESLVLGLSRLADQGRWAELADAPSADVVLVPSDDGGITRCFWPEELRDLLAAAGFDVDWVRPRSVLPQAVVERALTDEPDSLDMLVRTELKLAAERESEPVGIHLVASAVLR